MEEVKIRGPRATRPIMATFVLGSLKMFGIKWFGLYQTLYHATQTPEVKVAIIILRLLRWREVRIPIGICLTFYLVFPRQSRLSVKWYFKLKLGLLLWSYSCRNSIRLLINDFVISQTLNSSVNIKFQTKLVKLKMLTHAYFLLR